MNDVHRSGTAWRAEEIRDAFPGSHPQRRARLGHLLRSIDDNRESDHHSERTSANKDLEATAQAVSQEDSDTEAIGVALPEAHELGLLASLKKNAICPSGAGPRLNSERGPLVGSQGKAEIAANQALRPSVAAAAFKDCRMYSPRSEP